MFLARQRSDKDSYAVTTSLHLQQTTQRHVFIEAARTRVLESRLSPFIGLLRKEMRMMYPRSKVSPPVDNVGGYEYRSSYEDGSLVISRKKSSASGAPETILDSRWLGWGARGKIVTKALVSDDHSKIAYLEIQPQDEQGTLAIRHISSRSDSIFTTTFRIHRVFNFVWGSDSKSIFFTRLDDTLRSSRVFRIDIDSPKKEICIYTESDGRFFVDLAKSKDAKHIFINVNATHVSEVHILPDCSSIPVILVSRQQNAQCYLDILQDVVYALHNKDVPELRLCSLPFSKVLADGCFDLSCSESVVAAPAAGEHIEDVELFQKHAVLTMKAQGTAFLRCIDFESQTYSDVAMPDSTGVITPETNKDTSSSTFRFSYSSPFIVQDVCELDLISKSLVIQQDARPRMDFSNYLIEKLNVLSSDGTCHIPVTILRQKDLPRQSCNPCILLAYGAYGLSIETSFRIELLPALARGVTIAFAHVRGGGELGLDWHRRGRGAHKICSFTDLEDVADMLIREKYTSSERLGGIGTSAGGMLFAGVMNRRPDLFKALVLRVSFLDPLTTMKDPNSPLSSGEGIEWGDPDQDDLAYDNMATYAPYDNLRAGSKTSVLATAGSEDQRIPPWHALKFIVRMHNFATHSKVPSKAYFKLYEGRGHNQGGGDSIDEHAFEYAFLLSELGVQ
ncbi:hypothetical protein BASA62_010164 [Batrachochytrium salamandrivorans]|nr:hypothetical protein BASA62_010164 [Batrachochytrium salamandrivorans]